MDQEAGCLVDTSILVRYLSDDIPEQADTAEAVLEKRQVLLNSVVLLETSYVLTRKYDFRRDDVCDALIALLSRENVGMIDLPKDVVASQLFRCKGSGRVSFADALIVASMIAGGVERIFSFDRRLQTSGIVVTTPERS